MFVFRKPLTIYTGGAFIQGKGCWLIVQIRTVSICFRKFGFVKTATPWFRVTIAGLMKKPDQSWKYHDWSLQIYGIGTWRVPVTGIPA